MDDAAFRVAWLANGRIGYSVLWGSGPERWGVHVMNSDGTNGQIIANRGHIATPDWNWNEGWNF